MIYATQSRRKDETFRTLYFVGDVFDVAYFDFLFGLVVKLIKTKKQLLKVVRKFDSIQTWDRLGPCPYFLETPAVMFVVDGEEHLVLCSLEKIKELLTESEPCKTM